jgi:hypothetical protein
VAPTSPKPSKVPSSGGRALKEGRVNASGVNLALHKPASTSSVEADYLLASAAVDGDMTTRWGSGWTDPQWLTVDLTAVWQISAVKLAWEHAYAVAYHLDLSVDGKHWTTVYRTAAGTGGTRDIEVDRVPARYIRVYGTKRAGSYGYSLNEIEVR